MTPARPPIQQDKNAEIVFFDKYALAGGYERFHEESYETLFRLFDEVIHPQEAAVMVDIGCGTGAFTNRLHEKYPHVAIHGVDLCPRNIQTASALYPRIKFLIGDAEAASMPAESADVICFFGLLHHFPDFSNVARETYRILKPGGRYFALDPHLRNPVFWLLRSTSSPLYNKVGVTANERLLTRAETISVFSKAGFDAHARIISGLKFCSVESKIMRPFMGLYNLADKILSRTPLERMLGAWVISWGIKR